MMLHSVADSAADRRALLDATYDEVARALGYRYTRTIMTAPAKLVVVAADDDPYARLI